MAKYTEAELNVISFDAEDVISTSNEYDDEGNIEM
jgi:hypothetical protein